MRGPPNLHQAYYNEQDSDSSCLHKLYSELRVASAGKKMRLKCTC